VTLFASSLAKPLYTRLGFIEVGIVHIQVEGEEEFRDLPGMTLEAYAFGCEYINLSYSAFYSRACQLRELISIKNSVLMHAYHL
jgi:hypothetical protein